MPAGLMHLSTTMISGWKDCPERAWRSYQRRLEMGDDNEGTDATRFGNAAHNTMEHFHNLLMREEPFDDNDIYEHFNTQFAISGCLSVEHYTLAQDKLVEWLHKSIYERNGRTIATELVFVYCVETKEVWVNLTNEQLRDAVGFIAERGHTPVVSKIDRVDIIGETAYEVYDYKTNFLPFTREYIENSHQLGIYDLVVRALYPEATSVLCTFDMVRHGKFSVEFDDRFRRMLENYLVALYQQIGETEKPEQRLNQYCRWCEIRASCDAYKVALVSPLPTVFTDALDTDAGINSMYDELDHLNNLAKIVDKRKDELKEALMAKVIKDNLGEPLSVGARQIYLQQNTRWAFDTKAVVQVFRDKSAMELLHTVVSVTKGGIDYLCKQRPEFRDLLDPLMMKQFVSPSLKARSLKGGKTKEAPADE